MIGEQTTIEGLLDAARARIRRYTAAEAREAHAAGALVVDTRAVDDRRATGVIPGSVHVPLSVLPWRLDPASPWRNPALASPEREVIVVCAQGYSSSLTAALLRELGFDRAGDLVGGFDGWAAAGLAVLPAPAFEPPGLPGMGQPG